jgi:asparagine synthase (glutamine-hydrolysing)
MASALRHRGPDAHGHRCWPDAALVNTRLKIIDLSPEGDQPLGNETSTVWAVLNGEIYNHRDLRHWLQGRGHTFRGHSDTEVIPHLYEECGTKFVERLEGMFALALYDTESERLILARDRLGIKPLFYGVQETSENSVLAFASELRTLVQFPGIDDTPEPQAIFDVLALTFVPSPETFYRGIRSLEPGHTLEASRVRGSISRETHPYHRWIIAPEFSLAADAAVDRARDLLSSAVSGQLESEVPLGCLLSGGIDSSLVSAAARAGAGSGLRTFNVKFWDPAFDETWAARRVAEHLGTVHETLMMDVGDGSWEHVTGLLEHCGQPFADTSLFPVHAVCRAMRRHLTVALSGDGGDEAFGGYESFWEAERIAQLRRLPLPVWAVGARVADAVSRVAPRIGVLSERARDVAEADDLGIVQALISHVRPAEQERLMPGRDLEPTRRWFEPRWETVLPTSISRIERLSARLTEAHARLVLPSDFLFKVDIASMKEGLEVRVPMLDEQLFAFGLTLPHRLKVQGQTGKMILREIAARTLPQEIASKRKMGFALPMDTWVSDRFKAQVREYLLDPGSPLNSYLEPSAFEPMVEAFAGGKQIHGVSRRGLYRRVVTLLSLQLSLESAKHRRQVKRAVHT